MKFTVRWPDSAELMDRAQEKVIELFSGAAFLEIDGFEQIGPLTRHHYDVLDVDQNRIGKVTIDIYPDDSGEIIAEIEGIEPAQVSPLHSVYTSREAAAMWGLSINTVTQWANRGKFLPSEARKSEKVWVVTHAGMVRLTGREPNGT